MLFSIENKSYRAKMQSFFFFCFSTCHSFLFYSEVLLIAAAFVQVLSLIDFPSPKLYIKECGIKEKIFSFYR